VIVWKLRACLLAFRDYLPSNPDAVREHSLIKVDQEVACGGFFPNTPAMSPKAELIKGKICGVQAETIEDPLMQRVCRLDKLADEPAKGRPLEKVLR